MSEIPHVFGLRPPDPLPSNPLRAAFESEDSWYSSGIRELADLVGGLDALEALDATPHPDEPFEWTGVAAGDREVVGRVLDRLEAGVVAAPSPGLAEFERTLEADFGRKLPPRIDAESVTIARRLLRRIAMHGAGALRRSTPERNAAAVAWLALRSNGDLGRRARLTADELWRMFGVSSATDRWRTMLNAAGLPFVDPNPMSGRPTEPWLPDRALLHSRQRAWLIQRRDACIKLFTDEHQRREQARPIQHHARGLAVRGRIVTPRWAHVGVADGVRAYVAVAIGESDADAEVIMLNLSDARALIGMLSDAVNGPLPPSPGRRPPK